uniref:Armadillo repeat-containing protein 10 n=1 Tax=Cacopsylla melanoneura TaxID=428564 RepID=A0A8D8URC8_9HEMI
MSGPGASTNDKAINKVAVCSAMFAGFAYVGYSVIRTAFNRRIGQDKQEQEYPEHRLYFRRLSQTTQTDVLLGNLDLSQSDSGRIILRPMSVQERIKELNLRARMFSDTMIAIQANSSSPARHGPRSLQVSPWNSPRILSPVDVRQLMSSHSSDNLSLTALPGTIVMASPYKKRPTRFRKKSPQRFSNDEKEKEIRTQAESFLENQEHMLFGKSLDVKEAKMLVSFLATKNEKLLERVITTIGNSATMTGNQDMLRECGALGALSKLIIHPRESVQVAAIKTLGNLTLNENNVKELRTALPLLLSNVNHSRPNIPELVLLTTLICLCNIAVHNDWHEEFCSYLHSLFAHLETGSPQCKLQVLKLLVNLSCDEDMVPSLLAARAPKRFISLIDPATNEDLLIRVLTLLQNLIRVKIKRCIDPTVDLPLEEKAASPDTMYAAIWGVTAIERLKTKLGIIRAEHSNEDVKYLAKKIAHDLEHKSYV